MYINRERNTNLAQATILIFGAIRFTKWLTHVAERTICPVCEAQKIQAQMNSRVVRIWRSNLIYIVYEMSVKNGHYLPVVFY